MFPRDEAHDARGEWACCWSWDELQGRVLQEGRATRCGLLAQGAVSPSRAQRRLRALGWGQALVLVCWGLAAVVPCPEAEGVPWWRGSERHGASRSGCAAGAGSVESAAVGLSSQRTSAAPCGRTDGRLRAADAGTPKPLSLGP